MLMEEILHQLIGSLSNYFQVLYIPGGERWISSTKNPPFGQYLWPGTAIAIGGVLLYSLTKETQICWWREASTNMTNWKMPIFNRTYIDSFMTGFSSQPVILVFWGRRCFRKNLNDVWSVHRILNVRI